MRAILQRRVCHLFPFGRKWIEAQVEEMQIRTDRSRIPRTYHLKSINQAITNEGTKDCLFPNPSKNQTNERIPWFDQLF